MECGWYPRGGLVSRLITLAAALTLAAAAVGILAGSPMAQTGSPVYEACEPDRGKIDAAVLPEVVDQDLCPVAGRTIVDHGAATVVPESPARACSARRCRRKATSNSS
jgi:hypothetical protein